MVEKQCVPTLSLGMNFSVEENPIMRPSIVGRSTQRACTQCRHWTKPNIMYRNRTPGVYKCIHMLHTVGLRWCVHLGYVYISNLETWDSVDLDTHSHWLQLGRVATSSYLTCFGLNHTRTRKGKSWGEDSARTNGKPTFRLVAGNPSPLKTGDTLIENALWNLYVCVCRERKGNRVS